MSQAPLSTKKRVPKKYSILDVKLLPYTNQMRRCLAMARDVVNAGRMPPKFRKIK